MKSIVISDYDESWPDLFDAESRRLEAALDGLAVRIDHVGSTAIPGLAAKPVIDIQISVEDEQSVEHCRRALVEIGCEDVDLFHELAATSLPGSELRRRAAAAIASVPSDDAFAAILELWPSMERSERNAMLGEVLAKREGAEPTRQTPPPRGTCEEMLLGEGRRSHENRKHLCLSRVRFPRSRHEALPPIEQR